MNQLRSSLKRSHALLSSLALTAALGLPAVSQAQVVLTANDSLGTSSFNSAGGWSPAGVPTAGSTYSTMGYLLRSPTAAGNYTFAGDSLTVGGGSGGGTYSTSTANNNALIFKANNVNLTVNNLILDGSQIRDGLSDNNTVSLNGNLQVAANGGAFMNQCLITINSVISGSGNIYIGDNGNGSAGRATIFTSAANTFAGNIIFNNTHASAGYSRLTLAGGSLMNFMIGANGINNGISGIGTLTLDGSFKIDLTGAATTIGDSWTLVDQSAATVSYGSTFSVNGFTDLGGGLWETTVNGALYEYNTASGLLSVVPVPEPSSIALIGMGIAGIIAGVRRKK